MAYYPVDESGQQAPHWQSELVIKDHPEFSGQVLGNNRLFLCDKNGNGRIELKGEDANDPDYTEIIQESHFYAPSSRDRLLALKCRDHGTPLNGNQGTCTATMAKNSTPTWAWTGTTMERGGMMRG